MTIVKMSFILISFSLSACATDYVSQLSQPNFGRWAPPSVDIGSSALTDGAYMPKFWQAPCTTVDYRCAPPTFAP